MESLGQLLRGKSAVRLIGVYDGLSAHLAQRAGAQAMWASGLCICATKGLPDNEVATYETLVQRVEDIRRGSRLPVLADGNTGFGDEQVAGHVVRLLEDRGANGVSLEDKAFPRRNSFADDEAKPYMLEDPHTFAAKLEHACAARRTREFMVVARTEGFIAGEGVDEVLARADLYYSAGADAVIVHSKADDAREVLAFAQNWKRDIPVIVIPTTYPQLSFSAARAAGISGIICANQLMRATMWAAEQYLAQLMPADSIVDCSTPLSELPQLLSVVTGFGAQDLVPCYEG